MPGFIDGLLGYVTVDFDDIDARTLDDRPVAHFRHNIRLEGRRGKDGTEEQVREFLLTPAAIGGLIKHRSSISGAEVGCQGEVGVACSMAAGASSAYLPGLIWTLVRTDFKTRYHGTVGGYLWALCKPILMFVVLLAVFSFIFAQRWEERGFEFTHETVRRWETRFAPLLIESQGRIMNTSSLSGTVSGAFLGAYSMSKHGIEAYTDALAAEMAGAAD